MDTPWTWHVDIVWLVIFIIIIMSILYFGFIIFTTTRPASAQTGFTGTSTSSITVMEESDEESDTDDEIEILPQEIKSTKGKSLWSKMRNGS